VKRSWSSESLQKAKRQPIGGEKENPDTSRRRTRQGEKDSDRAGKGSEVEDTRDIPDETRREELRVEKEGDVRELDDSEVEKSRRKKTA
jgi:hypothetical protein